MPPHCYSLDGLVVTVAREALDRENVTLVLPADAEAEVNSAYARTIEARAQGEEAREVADLWFYETVVRLHRAGEGAPYTGLKPAGLDVGPVIPVAEQAIADEDPAALIELLTRIVRDQATHKFDETLDRKQAAGEDVAVARRYVTAMLGLQVTSSPGRPRPTRTAMAMSTTTDTQPSTGSRRPSGGGCPDVCHEAAGRGPGADREHQPRGVAPSPRVPYSRRLRDGPGDGVVVELMDTLGYDRHVVRATP